MYKNNNGSATSQVDFFAGMTALFIMLFLITLIDHNPPVQNEKQSDPEGKLEVNISWQDDLDADVDLHIVTPSGSVCYFMNPNIQGCHLTLDDVGHRSDTYTDAFGEVQILRRNSEKAVIRFLNEGDYVVYLHGYRIDDADTPVKVAYEILDHEKKLVVDVGDREVYNGLKRLVCRFTVKDGKIVDKSYLPYEDIEK